MVLIRLAHAAHLPTLDEALKQLENQPSGGGAAPRPNGSGGGAHTGGGGAQAVASQSYQTASTDGRTMRLVQDEQAPQFRTAPQAVPEPESDAVPLKSLADIANLADKHRDMAFKVQFKRCVRLVSIEPGKLEVNLTPDAPKTLLGDLTNRLKEWTGRRWIVTLSREEGSDTLFDQEASRRESVIADAKADPTVAAILKSFPGAKVLDVRIPDATDDDVEAETAIEDEVPVDPDEADED
jgi:DNA polymerase-3 subunit gamma/tau